MKKLFFLLLTVVLMPFTMEAQDDLYFTPTKESKKSSSSNDRPTYYAGSNRNVDEYNRHGAYRSRYQKIDPAAEGNDIIDFEAGNGLYPDSSYIDTTFVYSEPSEFVDDDRDFIYTRHLSRWDGFYDPWFYGYRGWRSPFWYSSWGWYDPWYYSWYDPWYYDWYYPYYYGGWGWNGWYSWYSPWHYGYYPGWGYYGGGGYAYRNPGTANHGNPAYLGMRGTSSRGSHSYTAGTFGGSRTGRFGSTSTASRSTRSGVSGRRVYSNRNGNFGGSRSSASTRSSSSSNRSYTPSRSSSSSSSFGGGSSFGGSRSGGGSFGGGHSGGGGRSGGGSFGGRR